MKSNKQLKYSNYAAISHFHGTAVNNLGLILNKSRIPWIHKVCETWHHHIFFILSYSYQDHQKIFSSISLHRNGSVMDWGIGEQGASRKGSRGWQRVSGLVFKSDFTNGMDISIIRRTGRSRAASCLVAPKIAIHGDFPLVVYHSVSEMADSPP